MQSLLHFHCGCSNRLYLNTLLIAWISDPAHEAYYMLTECITSFCLVGNLRSKENNTEVTLILHCYPWNAAWIFI